MSDEDEPVHGVEAACYSAVGPGLWDCHLYCPCGFVARGDTWEEAGAELDEHLEENDATA